MSAVYGLGAAITIVSLIVRGRRFWHGALSPRDQRLAWSVGFLLILPAGVLLHEFGHAIAIWSLGAEVAKLSWHVYWGTTVPVGQFGPLGSWWIALSGNIVGLLFAFGLLAAAMPVGRARPGLGLSLLVAGVLELVFTLIAYPLTTIAGYRGSDWATIYDFSATPLASSLVLLIHLGAVGVMWLGRQHLREVDWAITGDHLTEFALLHAAVARHPADVASRRALAQLFLDGHRPQWAAETAADGLKTCGENPALYAVLGDALMRRYYFDEALGPLTRGTELLTACQPDIRRRMHANRAIALAATGRFDDALQAFDALEEPLASHPAVQAWQARVRAAIAEGH